MFTRLLTAELYYYAGAMGEFWTGKILALKPYDYELACRVSAARHTCGLTGGGHLASVQPPGGSKNNHLQLYS